MFLKVVSAINSTILNSNCFRHDHMGDFPKSGHNYAWIIILAVNTLKCSK